MINNSAPIETKILYCESTIRKGNNPKKLTKDAPAPSVTKRAGSAQQISVADDANKDTKLTAVLPLVFLISTART